jgi:hypothetical protein
MVGFLSYPYCIQGQPCVPPVSCANGWDDIIFTGRNLGFAECVESFGFHYSRCNTVFYGLPGFLAPLKRKASGMMHWIA